MQKLFEQTDEFWLSLTEIPLEILPSSTDVRYTFTVFIKKVLQTNGNPVVSDITLNQEPLPNIEEFFQSIPTNNQIYKASLSRQLAADLPPH
jgi:hypothetical protein